MTSEIFGKPQNNELHIANFEARFANKSPQLIFNFFARGFDDRDVLACALSQGRAKI